MAPTELRRAHEPSPFLRILGRPIKHDLGDLDERDLDDTRAELFDGGVFVEIQRIPVALPPRIPRDVGRRRAGHDVGPALVAGLADGFRVL